MAKATLQLPTFFYISTNLKCYDCHFWVGKCLMGRLNRVAVSQACALLCSLQ
jgi:hypothetical protein